MAGLSYNNGNENDRLKFSGKELDEEQGLKKYHFGWRDYNPELGRWNVADPARQYASPYVYGGNNPIIGYDEDGRWFGWDDLIVSGVSFVVGYVSHGMTTGEWGKDALVSGGIAAGTAWLAYNTGGAVAGLIAEKGGATYSIISSTVGGTVGSATGNAANQLRYTGAIDMNMVGQSALEGFGGGLLSGVVEASLISKMGKFVGHHLAKHAISSTAYEVGANIAGGRAAFQNLSYGLNPGAIFPAIGDMVYATSPIWKDYAIDNLNIKTPEGINLKEISHIDLDFNIVETKDKKYLSLLSAELNNFSIKRTVGNIKYDLKANANIDVGLQIYPTFATSKLLFSSINEPSNNYFWKYLNYWNYRK